MTSEEWERGTEWPLAVAALAFLASYSLSVLDRDLTRAQHQTLIGIDYFTWALFVLDDVVRLILAKPRLRYVVRHLPDLLIVVLPVLRPNAGRPAPTSRRSAQHCGGASARSPQSATATITP